MAELGESSGLHSLASLHELEKRRAQLQADAARARAEVEQRVRKEAERAAAQGEHERRLAERAALAHAESARRAELSQLVSARQAEFERAEDLLGTNGELKSQLDRERAVRQKLELRLTSQQQGQRFLVQLAATACVCSWLAAAALYFGVLRPGSERELATVRQSWLSERQAHAKSQKSEASSVRRAEELSSRVSTLERDLRAQVEQRAVLPPAPSAGRNSTTRAPSLHPPAVTPCRDDGDPLNPCLKR